MRWRIWFWFLKEVEKYRKKNRIAFTTAVKRMCSENHPEHIFFIQTAKLGNLKAKRFNDLDNQARSQTYARVMSIEGGTGAAFSDEIGVTVTIGCTQYEIPRKYEGTIVLGSTGKTLTTSA